MAVETKPYGKETLQKTELDARVADYAEKRRRSEDAGRWLKTLGFAGAVIGAGLILASQAYAPFVAASTVGKWFATGKVAALLGVPLMIIGAVKESIARRSKP